MAVMYSRETVLCLLCIATDGYRILVSALQGASIEIQSNAVNIFICARAK